VGQLDVLQQGLGALEQQRLGLLEPRPTRQGDAETAQHGGRAPVRLAVALGHEQVRFGEHLLGLLEPALQQRQLAEVREVRGQAVGALGALRRDEQREQGAHLPDRVLRLRVTVPQDPAVLFEPSQYNDQEFDDYIKNLFREIAPGNNFIVGMGDNLPFDADINRVGRVVELIDKYGRLPIEV